MSRLKHSVGPSRSGWLQASAGHFSLWTALVVLVAGFAVMAGLFATVYDAMDLLANDPSWGHCLYFSVITQTTVGFGDVQPRAELLPRMVVATQAFVGLTFFTTGSALFIFKLLQSPSTPIVFASHAVFYPDEGVLRGRFVNRSRAVVYDLTVRASIRAWFDRPFPRFLNADMMLGMERESTTSVLLMEPMNPRLQRTAPTDTEPHDLSDFDTSKLVDFHPAYAGHGTRVAFLVTGSIDELKSSVVAYKIFDSAHILCGGFRVIDPEGLALTKPKEVDWSSWDVVDEVGPEKCSSCRFFASCRIVSRAPARNSEGLPPEAAL